MVQAERRCTAGLALPSWNRPGARSGRTEVCGKPADTLPDPGSELEATPEPEPELALSVGLDLDVASLPGWAGGGLRGWEPFAIP